MSGSKLGGIKTAITNKANDPNFYVNIGRKGGLAKTPKGFATMDPERLSAAGRLGGSISKRGKQKAPSRYRKGV